MDEDGTLQRAGTGQALVAAGMQERGGRPAGRAMAGFLTQLMMGTDASLRATRSERTRLAVGAYGSRAGWRARS